jgi:capsular exopolysaccharide synthesis family protein
LYGAGTKKNRILLVTSPQTGDGKTLAACNLAISMALAGKKTLLVDLNIRSPRLGHLLGMEDLPGLTGIVLKQCSIPRAITATLVDGLDFLDCGPTCIDPTELLNHDRFFTILRILACQYDHVVLDGPALLATSDALVLAAVANGVILTTHAEGLHRDVLAQVQRELTAVGADTLGVIVNQVARRGGGYRYCKAATQWRSSGTLSFRTVARPQSLWKQMQDQQGQEQLAEH